MDLITDVKWSKFKGLDPTNEGQVTVEATVVTGFEYAASSEVAEKLGVKEADVSRCQGRIIFDVPAQRAPDVIKMRTIDNVYVLIGAQTSVGMEDKETDPSLGSLLSTLDSLQWRKGLEAWKAVSKFKGKIFPDEKKEEAGTGNESSNSEEKKAKLELIPKFRCTCYRTGTKHSFNSMDAAKAFGGAVQDKFGWDVKMKGFDIEVVVNVDSDQVYHSIALTKESLFRRNIKHFGPTTLRATIANSLIRLAKVQPGDIVVDPMCGSGAIPIEGALDYTSAFHLCGDIHEKAYVKTGDNVKAIEEETGKCHKVDVVRWDVTTIPLRTASVDVFVSDLPFGKRSGSKADNRVLYPRTMLSMARVVRPVTGRAVVLTQDRSSMFKTMGKFNQYWKTTRQMTANIGGLTALVFIMARTDKTPPTSH